VSERASGFVVRGSGSALPDRVWGGAPADSKGRLNEPVPSVASRHLPALRGVTFGGSRAEPLLWLTKLNVYGIIYKISNKGEVK